MSKAEAHTETEAQEPELPSANVPERSQTIDQKYANVLSGLEEWMLYEARVEVMWDHTAVVHLHGKTYTEAMAKLKGNDRCTITDVEYLHPVTEVKVTEPSITFH